MTRPPERPTGSNLDVEQRQALEQWLRQIHRQSFATAAAQVLGGTNSNNIRKPFDEPRLRLRFCLFLRLPGPRRRAARQRRPQPPEHLGNLELTLEIRDVTQFGKPDLTPLQADFDVSGTRQLNSLNTLDGQNEATTRWVDPGATPCRHPGDSAAATGRVAQRAIQLQVQPAADSPVAPLAPVFIETSLDQDTLYVQAQAVLTCAFITRYRCMTTAASARCRSKG